MQTAWLLPGKNIWFKQDDIFFSGIVTSLSNKQVNVTVENSDKKATIPVLNCYQKSEQIGEYEDMCNMNILNEPQILANLKHRYAINKIYTKIGPTLIALNPYKVIETLYNKEILMSFREKVKNDSLNQNVIPHIFLSAGEAYNNLRHGNKKQAIVISGQSGAGKTQNTKYCMKFLTSLSHIHQHGEKQKAIEDIILQCNPILQAFGNSKTIRNSNSSRFGKYVRLFINVKQQMKGARIQNYLLQKSRVTSVSKKQRSFHIFYYLINSTDRESFGLLNNQKYEYLQSSGCLTAEGIDDKTDFRILKTSLQDIGFKKQETHKIWLVLAAILLLGNLQYDNKDNLANQNNLCKFTDQKLASRICRNLGLKIEQLNSILLESKHMIGKEVMIKKYDKNQCITTKNTFAKALYGRLFDYLIQKINTKLWIDKKDDRSISILDIFGFEIFEKNSFEQLCINFTNQRLQQLYTKYVFENEISELKKDGLGDKVKDLIPPDNKALIQLIQKRMGVSVFSLIDEKTALGAAKDQDIVVELRKMKHKSLYVDPEPNKITFMILHTQNPVIYNVQGFKYKNQDTITQQISKLIDTLFPISQSQQFKGKTLVAKFDKQLKSLNEQLEASQIHFIRCIKPNQDKKPNHIDERFVVQQIKYLGVLETIQIRKSAFPFRTHFNTFVDNFKNLVSYDKTFSKLSPPQQCLFILKKTFPGVQKEKNMYLIGKQRLYLKQEMQSKLNIAAVNYYQIKNKASIKIQKQFLKHRQRSKLLIGVRKFIKKMSILKKIMSSKIVKSKQIKLKFFKRYQEQVNKIKQSFKKMSQEKVNKLKEAEKLERQKKQKQKIENQKKNIQLEKEVSKEKFQTNNKTNHKTNNTSKVDNKDYETVLYDSVGEDKPKSKPMQKQKQQEPEFKLTKLSESYLNHASIINEDQNVLVKGELRIPMYQKNPQKLQKLIKLLTHLTDQYQGQQKQHMANNLDDPEFDVSSSVDDKSSIDKQLLKGQLGHKIVTYDYLAFFDTVLRKRKTLFGRAKAVSETLTAKDGTLKKSLISLSQDEQMKALQVFKLLLWVSDSNKTQKVYYPIQKIIEFSQNSTVDFKNQIFVQLLKQQNIKNQYSAIKMYQIMVIYLHLFKIDDNFLMAYLSCLLERFQDNDTNEKIKDFISYLFPRAYRQLISKQGFVSYMPTQFQLAALMCKRQIPVSIYFSIGNSIMIKVQSFETLADIKGRVLEEAGLNSKRIIPELIGFSEVMSFETEELEQNPLDDNRNIWDLLTYWEKAKAKFEQTNVGAPDFGLYLKVRYAYQVNFDDEESVELIYSQVYFDLFLGRLRIPLNSLLDCSALMKAAEPDLDVDFIVPLWATEGDQSKTEFAAPILSRVQKYKHLSRHQLRFQFIRKCSQSPLMMSTCFMTESNSKLCLKPKRIYVIQNDEIIEQIGIRKVLKWGCDQTTLILTIKQNNSQKVMTIKSQFAKIIGTYLSNSMKLIMALKGN